MVDNINVFDSKLVKSIVNDFYNHDIEFEDIMAKYNLERNELLNILMEAKVSLKALKKHLASFNIEDDKFVVISDTHIGSNYESNVHIQGVVEFCKYNNIKTIIHCGDLIQSTYRPVKKEYIDQEEQIKHLIDLYPSDFNSYILLGNHDYHTFKKKPELLKVIKSKPYMNIVGYKRAYFTWMGYLMSMSHDIEHVKIQIPNIDHQLNFAGHRHVFEHKVGSNKVYVPPLCDDLKYFPSSTFDDYPGFLLVERINNKMLITNYSFHHDRNFYSNIPKKVYDSFELYELEGDCDNDFYEIDLTKYPTRDFEDFKMVYACYPWDKIEKKLNKNFLIK